MMHVPPVDPCEIAPCYPDPTPSGVMFAMAFISLVMIAYIAAALSPIMIILLAEEPAKQDGMINRFR